MTYKRTGPFTGYEETFDEAARDTRHPWLPQPPVADSEASETRGVIENTLTERGKNYGDFTDNAEIAQDIKFVIRKYADAHPVAIEAYMEEALDLIATKIGRLLSGNPYHVDGWHDIAGYATLVEQRLNKRSTK